jgi:outer membrane protein TolC
MRQATRAGRILGRLGIGCFLFALTQVAAAQQDSASAASALTVEEVLSASETHFPEILDALARRRGADADVLAADGGFDLVFDADGFSRVDGFWDGSVVQGRATQPLRPLGADVYAGYRLSDGNFPIYEDEYFTNSGGELKVGVLFSLLRDREIDERRFAITDSRLALRQADLDVLLTKIGVQQKALVAYWRWVTTGRQLAVYDELLRIALDREGGLQEQVDSGARAEIFLVENKQNIIRRQQFATAALRDFRMAANALSFYYRDQDGQPVIPSATRLPAAPPLGQVDDLSVQAVGATSQALDRRPELQILKTAIDRAKRRISLADNNLKPRVDLGLEVSKDFGSVAEGGVSRDSTDTIIGFQFAVPLQNRNAKGAVQREQARIESLRQEQRLTADQIEVEVGNILLDLNVAEQLLELARQDVTQAETLQVAERERFSSGASDFFLVNIREETAANARVQYYAADLERRIARANYDAATVDLSRLGIGE